MRGVLAVEQRALLESSLPKRQNPGRSATWSRRQLFDGARSQVHTGISWRDVPEAYGGVGPGE
ncbi:transposase [Streptomyces sp. NPDC005811]|uniref:transposase n=1 Tax=Streptomyces sp. NPDC005811 TaxID=3154565 RepID=UPI0033F8B8E8